MHKARAIILAGLGAATLAGVAVAANKPVTHHMSIPLPDGSVANIEYVGDVAPKVTVAPAPLSMAFPSFGMFDRSIADMHRQIDAMMREVQQMQTRPITGVPGLNIASYGTMPAGSSSVTVVSTSIGGKTCTRTTEVTSQGAGKPPKVASNVRGECAEARSTKPVPTT
jgi:hypothetical protein